MNESLPPQGPPPVGGPSAEELGERWTEVVNAIAERPRDVELLLRAGQLSEQLGRRPETYSYYLRAWKIDSGKTFLAAKLRALASTPEEQEEVRKLSSRPLDLPSAIPDIFRYPLRGKGLPVMALGAAFFWAVRGLSGFGGLYSLGLGAFVGAYMALFYVDVCHSTVEGEDHLPDWPDPLRLQGVVSDVGKFVLPGLVSFLPFFLMVYLGAKEMSDQDRPERPFRELAGRVPAPGPSLEPPHGDPADPPVPPEAAAPVEQTAGPGVGKVALFVVGLFLAGLLGLAYAPLSTLANIIFGSPWTCLNFPFVFRSMGAAPASYALCLATGLGSVLVLGALEFVARLFHVALVTGMLLSFLQLYGMTVQMRLLGIFYRINQTKLGWMAG